MLINVNSMYFGFEDIPLLEDITVGLNDGDRVGLVGGNGTGKTTFLSLLLGELQPDEGSISVSKTARIGYLPQIADISGNRTLYAEMRTVFAELLGADAELRRVEHQMSMVADHESSEYRALVGEYNRLNNIFSAGDGYNIDVRIKTVLNGMGFSTMYERTVDTLSGGERTRLMLSKLLLMDLDLLILDEPTNHLDIATLSWLEKYLEGYHGALLIVSHDRYFLDKLVTKVWDLESLTIREYRGNYSHYSIQKAERIKSELRAYEKQQTVIAAMEDYAERNIARASTSNMAKSRLHQLANMERLTRPVTYTKPPFFRFSITEESVEEALTVTNLCVEVGDKVLIPSLNVSVKRGERLAIVGANGTGKSTFLKMLLGLVGGEASDRYSAISGLAGSTTIGQVATLRSANPHIRYGKNVSLSYYDQENLNLNLNNTVLSEMWFRFRGINQTQARKTLAQMLFSAEDMDKTVGALSGGERAKLAFAIVMQEQSNFIMLDEPTNHLDLASRDALERGLSEYAGTLIFVSHDRYFINAVATKVLELSNGTATLYAGNYDAYLNALRAENAAKQAAEVNTTVVPPRAKNTSYRGAAVRSQIAKLRLRVKETEDNIAIAEDTLSEHKRMMETTTEYARLGEFYTMQQNMENALAELYAEWERLSTELQELVGE